jgi:putative Holliday junction resolvase
VDYGERRIGLAVSDPTATIAQPLATLLRRRGKRPPVAAVLELATSQEVSEIVVGLPLMLSGDDSDWTRETRAFAHALHERSGLPVHLLDERFTSVQAERAVRSIGLKRNAREQKERIDAAAAMLILQAHLDSRSRG